MIFVSNLAWNKLEKALYEHDKDEFAWFGLGNINKNNEVFVDKIVFPKQTKMPTRVEIHEGEDLKYDNIVMWGHSHVNMSVFPSPQDDKTWVDFTSGTPPIFFKGMSMLILNRRLESYFQIKTNSIEYETLGNFVRHYSGICFYPDELSEQLRNFRSRSRGIIRKRKPNPKRRVSLRRTSSSNHSGRQSSANRLRLHWNFGQWDTLQYPYWR